ncbi:hypothetical protein [Cryobacterium sp. BB736]|uniref:hypothetical protein n=1 Tax=Cryobacterium sp. BB736 TaxID=2746963 RepID=UPI001876AF53|nr:hypothetical protein [Cryobacterium sp. BB736]
MGLFDKIFGRPEQPPQRRNEDEVAVERYEYLLRTAPPETIEQVHTEAFAKLTPEQRDILFQKLTESAPEGERPADNQPSTLARTATRTELRQPGTLTRALGDGDQRGGPSFGAMFGSSLLGTIAGYVIGSAIVGSFFDGGGADAGADPGADASGDAGADGGDFGGGFDGGGFDFGGF